MMLSMAQMSAARLNIADLKQLILDISDRGNAIERALDGVVDPRWNVVAVAVKRHIDTANEAVTQAEIAADAGDGDRARKRLGVMRTELTAAGRCLVEYEQVQGEAVVDG
jgi:hypothetical protein